MASYNPEGWILDDPMLEGLHSTIEAWRNTDLCDKVFMCVVPSLQYSMTLRVRDGHILAIMRFHRLIQHQSIETKVFYWEGDTPNV